MAAKIAAAPKVVKTAIAASFLAIAFVPQLAHASERSAAKAYAKKDYTAAKKDYVAAADKSPERLDLRFDAGAANYRAGDYAAAMTDFQKWLWRATTLGCRRKPTTISATHNIAPARATLDKDKPATIEAWKHAVESYEGALALNAKDQDAAYNLDFVTKRLAKLEEEQKQQQQKDEKNDQNKDQKQSASSDGDQQERRATKAKTTSKVMSRSQPTQNLAATGNPTNRKMRNKSLMTANPKRKRRLRTKQHSKQRPSKRLPTTKRLRIKKHDKDVDAQSGWRGSPARISPSQAPTRPGELSPQQARAMLEALKSDQHSWIRAPDQRGGAPAPEDAPGKDW